MSTSLPAPIQHKLEQTLNQWRHWHCQPPLKKSPEFVSLLGPGLSNFSALVESGRRFVVRLDGIRPAANGLNRQSEWHSLVTAAEAGLAPTPHYFNPELGSLVCDYLPPDPGTAPVMDDVARLLRHIHQLPARHHRLDLAERIRRYENQLQHREHSSSGELRTHRQAIDRLLARLQQFGDRTVLCHNDLLLANRIYSNGRLYAIDWEYCAMGNPWYDIAVVVNGDVLDEVQTAQLLTAYLGRPAREQEWQALLHYGCIYRYLELLWYLALERQLLPPSEIQQKLTALQSRLEQLQP